MDENTFRSTGPGVSSTPQPTQKGIDFSRAYTTLIEAYIQTRTAELNSGKGAQENAKTTLPTTQLR
jgi:hypothetical protein